MRGLCYSIAKAASIHLARRTAVELGRTVFASTAFHRVLSRLEFLARGAGLEHSEADEWLDCAKAAIAAVLPRWQPLPNVTTAEDIAHATLFLASDASRMITGHNLVVDGGISAGWPAATVREDIALFRQAVRNKQLHHSEGA